MKSLVRQLPLLLRQMGQGLAAQDLAEMRPRRQKSGDLNPILPPDLKANPRVLVVGETALDPKAIRLGQRIAERQGLTLDLLCINPSQPFTKQLNAEEVTCKATQSGVNLLRGSLLASMRNFSSRRPSISYLIMGLSLEFAVEVNEGRTEWCCRNDREPSPTVIVTGGGSDGSNREPHNLTRIVKS